MIRLDTRNGERMLQEGSLLRVADKRSTSCKERKARVGETLIPKTHEVLKCDSTSRIL